MERLPKQGKYDKLKEYIINSHTIYKWIRVANFKHVTSGVDQQGNDVERQ